MNALGDRWSRHIFVVFVFANVLTMCTSSNLLICRSSLSLIHNAFSSLFYTLLLTHFRSFCAIHIECYSSLEDAKCTANNVGDATDMIYWQKQCTEIGKICSDYNLSGSNAAHCLNSTTNELVPLRSVIQRVLASEEYY